MSSSEKLDARWRRPKRSAAQVHGVRAVVERVAQLVHAARRRQKLRLRTGKQERRPASACARLARGRRLELRGNVLFGVHRTHSIAQASGQRRARGRGRTPAAGAPCAKPRALACVHRLDQVLHVAFRAGDGAFHHALHREARRLERRAHLVHRALAHLPGRARRRGRSRRGGFRTAASPGPGTRCPAATAPRNTPASCARPMKLRSATSTSKGAPSSAGSAVLMFVRSNTATRASCRSFQASWP